MEPIDDRNFMPKDKPVHEVRLGAIKAAIWKNDTDNGVRFNTTFSRLYKDGDEWKNTFSLAKDRASRWRNGRGIWTRWRKATPGISCRWGAGRRPSNH